ncbi:GNAT family N-acetyltransferase [Blautia faecicola]|uniref:GNAT family N-acetyltransferase n=1 Tax=Blautia faecicola TaxID=2509240 RepID=UPI003FD829EB
MKIYELQERTTLLPVLLTIWEDSVRATHHFLSDTEIEQIREYVPQALQNVSHLLVAQNESGESIGFMGTENNRLEMLFLSPKECGKGIGKQMLQYGMEQYGIRELTVNEQNPQAVVFYMHLGFETYKRADCDEEGNSYPLLYMTLKDTEGKI